eukprot:5968441-Lingulodinium_polyedra.AAC.1
MVLVDSCPDAQINHGQKPGMPHLVMPLCPFEPETPSPQTMRGPLAQNPWLSANSANARPFWLAAVAGAPPPCPGR